MNAQHDMARARAKSDRFLEYRRTHGGRACDEERAELLTRLGQLQAELLNSEDA